MNQSLCKLKISLQLYKQDKFFSLSSQKEPTLTNSLFFNRKLFMA